jgi:hypothetical protein
MKSEFAHDASTSVQCIECEIGEAVTCPGPVLFLPEKHETWLISAMSDGDAGATAKGATR